MKITLELYPEEAHFVLPAIAERRLEWSKAAANAKNEPAREYSDVAARVLSRVETALCDQMYPEAEA